MIVIIVSTLVMGSAAAKQPDHGTEVIRDVFARELKGVILASSPDGVENLEEPHRSDLDGSVSVRRTFLENQVARTSEPVWFGLWTFVDESGDPSLGFVQGLGVLDVRRLVHLVAVTHEAHRAENERIGWIAPLEWDGVDLAAKRERRRPRPRSNASAMTLRGIGPVHISCCREAATGHHPLGRDSMLSRAARTAPAAARARPGSRRAR